MVYLVSWYIRLLYSLIINCRFADCLLSDTFIQKTKQRYNSPRSLSTKINLADMQTEIKLRPPYQLSPEDLQAINGFSAHTASKYKGIGRTHIDTLNNSSKCKTGLLLCCIVICLLGINDAF